MTQAENKIFQLFDVLEYQRKYKPSLFSVGERIMIHQERAAWFDVCRKEYEGKENVEPSYQISASLQKKVDEITHWLNINK